MNKEVSKAEIETSKPIKERKREAKKVRPQILGKVDLTVEAFLGAASMTISELGELEIEDVVELDAPLNAAVELRLNGIAIASGELVAVGEKFGVKITTIAE